MASSVEPQAVDDDGVPEPCDAVGTAVDTSQVLQTAEQRGNAALEGLDKLLPGVEGDVELVDEVLSLFEAYGVGACDTEAEAEAPQLPEFEGGRDEAVLDYLDADDSVSLYLSEMAREPLLTREEEVELARCIELGRRAGERLDGGDLSSPERRQLETIREAAAEARARFIRANTRLVVSVAKGYRGRGVPFLDLIQEGNMGLMSAVERYDYHLGHRFSTYATWWIRQAITRALIDQGYTIRLPVHVSDNIHRMRRAVRRLEKELGRQPTEEEIAQALEITPNQVRWLLIRSHRPISLAEPMGGEEDNELADVIEDAMAPAPVEIVAQTMLSEEIDKVLQTLVPREARVLRLRYGLRDGQGRTLEEIGALLGLTKERIRQIEGLALRNMRDPARSHALHGYL